MKLTNKEKAIIENLRKEEEKEKPYREAFLKHDLWDCDCFDQYCDFDFSNPFKNNSGFPQLTEAEVKGLIKAFQDSFEKVLEKGARFVSYIDDGEELWYDDEGYGIEGVDNDWAEKYLENFKELRKRK